jgi:SEC-C motif
MDDFQSFLDATPSKGVIIVEYYWQRPGAAPSAANRRGRALGAYTSMAFFKRIRASDDCWCGSRRRFGRCHRREDDWTYVTLDPDQVSYSPVVLLERTFLKSNPASLHKVLGRDQHLLQIEHTDSLTAWGIPAEPQLSNEIGQLILGTIGVGQNQVHIETNSEKRFAHLMSRFHEILGVEEGEGATLRAEPQKAFVPLSHRRKR